MTPYQFALMLFAEVVIPIMAADQVSFLFQSFNAMGSIHAVVFSKLDYGAACL